MEYVLPFASMIKTAALPTLPAPPALPDYGTHKVRGKQAEALFLLGCHPELVHARAFGLLRPCWRPHPACDEGGGGWCSPCYRRCLDRRHARACAPVQYVPAGTCFAPLRLLLCALLTRTHR